MSHADHQDFLADPEPITPPERAWAQVYERYKALLDALAALEQQMREAQSPVEGSSAFDAWVKEGKLFRDPVYWADQLQALRRAHGATA